MGYNANLIETGSVVIGGDVTVTYTLYLHVRAAVELMAYSGGTSDGYFQVGGTPQNYPNTRVKLVVSDPAATFYLNRSASVPTNFSVALDYYAPIPVKGGATLTLSLERQSHALFNQDQGGATVVTQLAPFTGEYVQLDFATTLEHDVVEKRAGAGTARNWVFSGFEENVYGDKAEV